MKCPNCGLINPEDAMRCDCGYDFTTNHLEKSYLYGGCRPKESDISGIANAVLLILASVVAEAFLWHLRGFDFLTVRLAAFLGGASAFATLPIVTSYFAAGLYWLVKRERMPGFWFVTSVTWAAFFSLSIVTTLKFASRV